MTTNMVSAIKTRLSTLILLVLALLSVQAEATFCYFSPPDEWQFADQAQLSPRVQVAFIGDARKSFRPSLNLAIEENVDLSLPEYLKCIKTLHEKEAGSRWRDLGSFQTLAGLAHLTSLDKKTKGGDARLLQLILIKDKKAYILTGASSKEEFFDFYKDFEKAFRSLCFTDNLMEGLTGAEKQASFTQLKNDLLKKWKEDAEKFSSAETHFTDERFQKEIWIPFQQRVVSEATEWGRYGQLLFLKETQKELFEQLETARELSF